MSEVSEITCIKSLLQLDCRNLVARRSHRKIIPETFLFFFFLFQLVRVFYRESSRVAN